MLGSIRFVGDAYDIPTASGALAESLVDSFKTEPERGVVPGA